MPGVERGLSAHKDKLVPKEPVQIFPSPGIHQVLGEGKQRYAKPIPKYQKRLNFKLDFSKVLLIRRTQPKANPITVVQQDRQKEISRKSPKLRTVADHQDAGWKEKNRVITNKGKCFVVFIDPNSGKDKWVFSHKVPNN